MTFKFRTTGQTDVGLKRDHNEDNLLVSDELGLFAVADGMGGHAAGEVASETAILQIENFVQKVHRDPDKEVPLEPKDGLTSDELVLHTAVIIANKRVCSLAEENKTYGGMGTTLALIYFTEGKAHVAHVGDSRVYLFRENELTRLTRDHSWVNEQVERNLISEEEAHDHRWRNVITRALGSRDTIEAEISSMDPVPGDVYLVCSDGLTSMIDDDAIVQCLRSNNGDLDRTCAELVRLANEAGGLDNISVVLVCIES